MTFLSRFDSEFAPKLDRSTRPRRPSFRAVFDWLEHHHAGPFTLIETGCARQADAWSDGMSTVIFDAFLQHHGGSLVSIDREESHCRLARTLVNGHTQIVQADSVSWLTQLARESPDLRPDLLYLDSLDVDWNNPHQSAFHHLQELRAALPLVENCLVVVDDHWFEGKPGKSRYIAEFMRSIGAEQVIDDYQGGWVMPARSRVPLDAAAWLLDQRLESGGQPAAPPPPKSQKLVLVNRCSPGDVLMVTAAIRDLHRAWPGRFFTAVDTCCPDLWQNNPHIAALDGNDPQAMHIECHHPPMLDHCNTQPGHYIQSVHELLADRLGIKIPITRFAPDLHLSDDERAAPPLGIQRPYWVMVAGGKRDVTVKWWPTAGYQRVVDHYKDSIHFVQAGSSSDHHPPLSGVTNLVGKTSMRELVRLIHHAEGVVCPVTAAMHIAAAFEKPCVVLAGGREPPHWEMYPGHAFLHTVGQLPCCRITGCWKARVRPLDDEDADRNNNLCLNPTVSGGGSGGGGGGEPVAQCMTLITPVDVCRQIDRYRGRIDGAAVVLTPTTAAELMQRAAEAVPPYPGSDAFAGRGIVIPAGGRYFTQAWVCIHMLRHLGCTLPIQLWHLGPAEMSDAWRQAIAPLGVECVDAHEVRKQHPARILNGWELKPYAILHSRFKEVLHLDADNVPIVDPTFLFETPQYQQTGAIFWPDYGQLSPDRSIWSITGVPYRDEPEFESGQIVVDKERCWAPLNLAMWMNEHSDFWYGPIHGDKDTFHLAWRKLGVGYAMPSTPIQSLEGVMCQHDFTGRRIFQHRNMHKWSIDGPNKRIEGFVLEDQCLTYVRQLLNLLPVETQQFDYASADAATRALADDLCRQRWLYRRVGYDERAMSFTRDGFVAEGSAGCERVWNIVFDNTDDSLRPALLISAAGQITCRLSLDQDGHWRGRWLVHERMPIELSPCAAKATG